MKNFYGAVLNNVHLMLNKAVIVLIAITLPASGIGIAGVWEAQMASQLLALVIIPLAAVLSARTSFNSSWNTFENKWATSPKIMIISRYLLFAVVYFIVSFLWQPLFIGNAEEQLLIVCSVYLILAVYYPIMYLTRKYSFEFDITFFIFISTGVSILVWQMTNRFESIVVVLVTVWVYVLSAILSVVIISRS